MDRDLISRSALLIEFEWLKYVVNESSKGAIQETIQRIKEAPAADAVEVVRCKDCEHKDWRQNPEHGKVETVCKHPCGLKNPGGYRFCSYGERKDNGKNESK